MVKKMDNQKNGSKRGVRFNVKSNQVENAKIYK